MGRAFEYRKATKLKRWGNMSRVFTKLGKQITIAAKAGSDPETNPRLRALIQNAKAENMPKDNIDRAIKRAIEKDQSDYKEVVYEGYGPYGIAFLVETATDNPTRTVANVRSYFNKYGGSLGTSGSVEFMFDHKCVFKVKMKPDIDLEELELNLIDYGVEEIFVIDDEIMIYGAFESFGAIQKYLEENGFEIISGSFDRIPTAELKEVTPEQLIELHKLIEKFEEDDDVQNVYHNMKEPQ
jgi:YebC/PmpR family DNA-binding regulatory protein